MDASTAATLFFLLLAGHAVGDFALQTEFVALNKQRPKVRGPAGSSIWPHLLFAHSLHHGLIVYLITQRLSLGIAETFVHGLIDLGKGEQLYGFHFDQALHIATKLVWLLILAYGVA